MWLLSSLGYDVPHREGYSIWVVHGVPHREGYSIWVIHGVPHREGYSIWVERGDPHGSLLPTDWLATGDTGMAGQQLYGWSTPDT